MGDVAKINMGQSPDGANYTTNPKDAILVQGNADMSDGWVLPRVYTKQITKQAHVGDLIFSVRAPVGEVGKTQYNVVIGRGVAAISGNEFIFQSLKRMNSLGYWTKLAAGSTFESINSDTLKAAEFAIPKKNEQAKIGEILLKIDNLITLHQRKQNKQISGALSKKCYIKIANSWEQRKLCDIADKVTEKNANTNITETFTNSAEFGIVSQRDYFDHDISNFNNLSGYYVVQSDDFVYNPRISVTAPVGPINRNKLSRKGVMSPLYTVFRVKNIDFTFLEWYFKSEYWHGFMRFNGDSGARSDRFSIKDETMFQMPLPYPDRQEQEHIGKLLSKYDNLITLHQRKFKDFHGGFL